MHQLPETGFLRLKQIIGDMSASPPIPALYPISRSSWYAGVREGRFPKPVKIGPRCTAWRAEDIRALIEEPFVSKASARTTSRSSTRAEVSHERE